MYPPSLSYGMSRLSGFARQTLKMYPSKTDSVSAGTTIHVDLPSNSIVDLDSLVFSGTLTTSASTGTAGKPRHAEELIDRIDVVLNGVTIMSCNNLALLYSMLYNLSVSQDATTRRALYQFTGDVAPGSDVTNEPFKIHSLLGFCSSSEPRLLDLNLIGDCRISVTLSKAAICPVSSAGSTVTMTLNSCEFWVDVIALQDNVYYESMSRFLQGGNVLEIPFTVWYSHLAQATSTTQSTKFSINTQSLDLCLAGFPTNWGAASQASNATTGDSDIFTLKYGSNVSDFNFSVNNQLYPSFRATADDAFSLLTNAMGTSGSMLGGISPKITSADVFKSDFWCAGYKWNLDDVNVSGINTLGSGSALGFQTTGDGVVVNPANVAMFAATTATLRVGAGQSLEIIY